MAAAPRHRAAIRRDLLWKPAFGRDDRTLLTQLVTFDTADHYRWDGMLYTPLRPSRRRPVAIVVVHGSVGNYISGLPRRVSFGLARAGFTVLSINTRMANYGVFFGGGLMHRTPLDLDGALGLLRRQGVGRIALAGFSMGATMVTHYQALRRPHDVVAVATLAHPASLPRALRRRWDTYGAQPSYEEMTDTVRASLWPNPEDPRNDRIVVVTRATGPSTRPEDAEIWTYRTWWFSRGPEAYHAVSRLRIGQVTVPIGIFQAGDDELVEPSEGPELARIAVLGTAPSVHFETIAAADHVFGARDEQLADALGSWLAGVAEQPALPPHAPDTT